ncbi:complex I subunit 1 family protein [Nonomuraea turcica]|uniref:complex I subunit 1 family protein n=1 Tax=Nonomuraea sp. G32 TaxID=3067274 RepID=UPI00273AED0B|nr:complex I subunit 1 family protein [Nonomuraea sp. G32]MDP4509883.1 NADH-quinone oxidoreductase subunit H [Nonomuraea sp. G32]
MPELTPVWTLVAYPAALGAFTVAAAAFDTGRPLSRVARLLVQQRRLTLLPDTLLMRLGVVSLLAAAVLAGIVLPLGDVPLLDLDVGIVWFNAMEVCVWGSLWLTGWGVNAIHPLVGGYRFIAQGLAYELPHMFALVTVALGAGSLRMTDVVAAQQGLWFAVWMPAAFGVYLISALAIAFWGPMSQPLGQDLAGGVTAELAGADRLLFETGRYALLTVVAAAAVPLFLGGGAGPWLPDWLWTALKTAAVLAVLIGARHRFPAVRMDRFMTASWVALIPVMLVQLLIVGIVVL